MKNKTALGRDSSDHRDVDKHFRNVNAGHQKFCSKLIT